MYILQKEKNIIVLKKLIKTLFLKKDSKLFITIGTGETRFQDFLFNFLSMKPFATTVSLLAPPPHLSTSPQQLWDEPPRGCPAGS